MTSRAQAPDARPTPRRQRPGVIELAAALLIVGGVLQLIGAFGAALSLPAGAEPVLILTAAIDVATIVAGVLIRTGRLWLLVVNYVAVLGFLDLLRASSSPVALMLAVGDVVVVIILVLNRAWFAPVQPDDAAA
jgi:hypothetical protein